MQEKTIRLAKQLIETFAAERDERVDMTSRWMAHYIAEQMIAAENATGAEKGAAEGRCFRTILTLWEHRSHLPNGCRPFESFALIFESLVRLHPDQPRPYYLSSEFTEEKEGDADSATLFVKLALAADLAARVVIDTCIAEATRRVTTPSIRTWLENALTPSLVSDLRASDIRVVVELVDRATQIGADLGKPQPPGEEIRGKIERRIEKLDGFVTLCQALRNDLAKQLEDLPK